MLEGSKACVGVFVIGQLVEAADAETKEVHAGQYADMRGNLHIQDVAGYLKTDIATNNESQLAVGGVGAFLRRFSSGKQTLRNRLIVLRHESKRKKE